MNKTLEEQAIDNERTFCLMAATLAAGRVIRGSAATNDDDMRELAEWSVRLAKAIQKEAGK